MKKIMSVVAVVVGVAIAGVAIAGECPLLVKQLRDAKVADKQKGDDVKMLTDRAEKLHGDGKHADSVVYAEAAAKLAGLEMKRKK